MLLFFKNLKLKIMFEKIIGDYLVKLIDSIVYIYFKNETIKCIDVHPATAVEQFNTICGRVAKI